MTKTTKATSVESVIKTTPTSKTSETEKVEVKKTAHKFEPDELIPVRSITQGTLLMPGSKSKILYTWESYGDIVQVEYQDLYTLKASRSGYLYKPYFIIENDELLEQAHWKDLKGIYDNLLTKTDISDILNLSPADFEETLKNLPEGFKDAVKMEVSTRLDNGTFDSIKKVKIVDKVCGTDLFNTMQRE